MRDARNVAAGEGAHRVVERVALGAAPVCHEAALGLAGEDLQVARAHTVAQPCGWSDRLGEELRVARRPRAAAVAAGWPRGAARALVVHATRPRRAVLDVVRAHVRATLPRTQGDRELLRLREVKRGRVVEQRCRRAASDLHARRRSDQLRA